MLSGTACVSSSRCAKVHLKTCYIRSLHDTYIYVFSIENVSNVLRLLCVVFFLMIVCLVNFKSSF